MKDLHVECDEGIRGFGRKFRVAAWWVEPSGYAAIDFQIKRDIPDGEELPFIEFESKEMLEDFLQPFLRLAEKLGIKGPEAAEIRGELKATKAHLKDLRLVLSAYPAGSNLLKGEK